MIDLRLFISRKIIGVAAATDSTGTSEPICVDNSNFSTGIGDVRYFGQVASSTGMDTRSLRSSRRNKDISGSSLREDVVSNPK